MAIALLASVFITSCQQTGQDTSNHTNVQQSSSVKLKSLKVGGASVEIKDIIDLKKTTAEKISIEYAPPNDATVTFTPELENGNWNLGSEEGKKILTILVKKDSESHTYKVNIEKVKTDSLLLKKIYCGKEEKNEIISTMVFKDVEKLLLI